ncbi:MULTISPECIES: hypothetical protein [unclassified Bosea (in: a-proteobacteria)]|uniref:hypothetical protein n=1 Tax=unclassified Bosea (in: a-proteobacteria) TaxID=2653178 RepID=UPI0009568817|nr:hypothetical protein [Bosea sp. TND4EK4]SIR56241.1 hypothetical protein SAMN05880592_13112 [Bosea sp. TND4EK4]
MKTMKEGGDTARDEARPSAEHLARYARSYRMTTDQPVRFFWLWQEAMAHALLLEQQADDGLPDQGEMTALQLAEGARATARFFAFMLAEAPARKTEHFEAKIMVYEAMAFDEAEIARTHTALMVEAAMQQDARELGINLSKIPVEPGGSPSRH